MTTNAPRAPELLRLETGEELEVNLGKPHVRASCPFCGGDYRAGTFINGDAFLMHSKPECSRFVHDDPIDFMTAARHAGARPLPWHPSDSN